MSGTDIHTVDASISACTSCFFGVASRFYQEANFTSDHNTTRNVVHSYLLTCLTIHQLLRSVTMKKKVMIMDSISGMKIVLVKLTNKCVHMEINPSIMMVLQPETVDLVGGWIMMDVPAFLMLLMN